MNKLMRELLRLALVFGISIMLLSCGKDTEHAKESSTVSSEETIIDESSNAESSEEVSENITVEYNSDEVIEIH